MKSISFPLVLILSVLALTSAFSTPLNNQLLTRFRQPITSLRNTGGDSSYEAKNAAAKKGGDKGACETMSSNSGIEQEIVGYKERITEHRAEIVAIKAHERYDMLDDKFIELIKSEKDGIHDCDTAIHDLRVQLNGDEHFQFLNASSNFSALPTTLSEFLGSCDKLTKNERFIPQTVLDSYCSGKGTRDSIGVVEEMSSAQDTLADGGIPLNKFKYSSMSENARPMFISFKFDEDALENLVRNKLKLKDGVTFDDFLNSLIKKLRQIRSIIYSGKFLERISNVAWSEMRLQALMQLFLNDMFGFCDFKLVASGANKEEIEFDVGEVTWNGFTDIMCHRLGVMRHVDQADSTLELKVAFGPHSSRLYHSEAAAPKQQLLGQGIGLLTKERTHVLSYLTDIIALSVMYYKKDCAYLSERVTGAKAFCLRLLLQCCNLIPEDWAGLLPANMNTCSNVNLADDEGVSHEEEEEEGSSSSGGGGAPPPAISQRHTTRSTTGKENCGGGTCYKLGCEELDARERRMAEISNYQEWEAKCFSHGAPYLGADALSSNTFRTI